MASHLHTGRNGELLAGEFLTRNGYLLQAVNWRHGHLEVDIIASKMDVLHFIEVKTRSSYSFGPPELKVDYRKLDKIKVAASEYLYQFPQWVQIQFDVISVVAKPGNTADIYMIEDFF